MKHLEPQQFLRINFLLSLLGAAGSLYFSEILKLPPCSLCWYQRVFLYPLVFIFSAALLSDDSGYRKYALPIALTGLAIAVYHNLLIAGWIAEPLTPCTGEVSCTKRQVEFFGFATIPLMSLVSFLLISIFIVLDRRRPDEK